MRSSLALFAVLLGLVTSFISNVSPAAPPALVAPTDALTPAEEKNGFHLPPGFEIQLVASEPDIQKPMNIAFDARGRLWVTSTVEYPYPVKPGAKGRDTVKI